MSSATAIILAGGRSARMGTDKRMLPWHGSTLLETVIAAASTIATELLVVVDEPGRTRGLSMPGPAPVPVREVVDELPGIGPLGGLHAGLRAASNTACVVCPCDAPFVSPELLLDLLTRLDGHLAAVPVTADGSQPLCAAYDARVLAHIERYQASGGRSMRGLLDALPDVLRIPAELLAGVDDERDPFRAVNTPGEYDDALGCGTDD